MKQAANRRTVPLLPIWPFNYQHPTSPHAFKLTQLNHVNLKCAIGNLARDSLSFNIKPGLGKRNEIATQGYANEVQNCLYNFKMMDEFFQSSKFRLHRNKPPKPPFTASYLEYRVRNERQGGYARLLLLREIAEKLHLECGNTPKKDTDFESELTALCSLAVETGRISKIFEPGPLEENEASEGLYIAAVYRNALHIIMGEVSKHQGHCHSNYLFGSVNRTFSKYGSEEAFTLVQPRLYNVIWQAAQFGRIEMVRFLFKKRQQWRFDELTHCDNRSKLLDRVICTPSVEIWEYSMEWRRKYPHLFEDRKDCSLRKAAQLGWIDMVRHLLQLGANTELYQDDGGTCENALYFACVDGCEEIVQLLLDHSADTKGMMAVAARHGHQRIVQMLIAYGADTEKAISEAAAGGHIAIVRTLLDHGVSIHEVSSQAFVSVIELEHTALLGLLIERAGGWDPKTHQECLEVAKKEGLVSMEMLLNEYGDM
ncbi:ankyrin [Amniculicola lignicola CBS 123094]|uniref:Ankyrin n=1 Tax=Amniculicola lignicola CBS 123094 TaxID=1392246 RepID=A0A6A5WUA9_9PLEO|nr:ankyrin [Amniculicola lignicola CBS 123094]